MRSLLFAAAAALAGISAPGVAMAMSEPPSQPGGDTGGSTGSSGSPDSPTPVPEPGTLGLAACGVIALGYARWRARRKR